jgi:hypothetical protein
MGEQVMQFYDAIKNWRRIKPHLADAEFNRILVEDFNKYTYGRCSTVASDKRSITGRDRLTWRKDGVRLLLFHGSDQNPLAIVEPDAKYPFLYRIRYPDGRLSDMANLTRAKDAACWFALRSLNSGPQETPSEGPQARKKAEAVGSVSQSANRAQQPRRRLLARGRS